MELVILLAFSALCAWICNEMAKSRRRNITLWTILGFCFPLPAILILLLIGKKVDG